VSLLKTLHASAVGHPEWARVGFSAGTGVDPDLVGCEALSADLFFGLAHNNLGVLYLKEDKLYEAANEFEWARKLMPGHPDPRMNLGEEDIHLL
jgi:hypothetical protein